MQNESPTYGQVYEEVVRILNTSSKPLSFKEIENLTKSTFPSLSNTLLVREVMWKMIGNGRAELTKDLRVKSNEAFV